MLIFGRHNARDGTRENREGEIQAAIQVSESGPETCPMSGLDCCYSIRGRVYEAVRKQVPFVRKLHIMGGVCSSIF